LNKANIKKNLNSFNKSVNKSKKDGMGGQKWPDSKTPDVKFTPPAQEENC